MSNIYKKIRITWEYPKQPTSLQVGYVRIVRSTEPFVVETALAQTQIDYRKYDSSFTSFEDTQDLQENTTYYYMIIVYGDIDNSISAATDLYSVKIEAPKKLYLGGRGTYSYSVRLDIPEWNTVGAWEFKVDGKEYIFDNDESLYDALVSLYSQNIAMPHRLDELPSSDEIARFDIYNNNAHVKTLWFKYVGLQTGTKIEAEVFDGSIISDKVGLDEFEILLAGSCHAQVNTIRNFQVNYNKQYLLNGCFYSIELNGKVYAHQLPLSELYNFNGNGITALFREYPELGDILGGYPNGSGVVLYNRTFQPITVKIRLDKNLPYLNGNESVWSAEQPTALYLPIVPEEPTPEQVEYYPLGIKQNQTFVPVDITNEGYVFELGPALPEPLNLDISYLYELDSITRDPVNLSGQVNYSDARISLTWKDVVYIAQVASEKSDGKYNWAFEELPYDLFEDVVVESLSGTINFTITAKTETDEVVRELDVTYHKTTFLKYIGNGVSNNPIGFIGQTGDVVRYPDGTVLNVNTANTNAILLKNMTGETVIELTGNRSYYSIVTLAGHGLVEVTELPRHARITGIKFHANIINLDKSSNLTKVPLYLPENIVNLSSAFENCTKFNQDLSQWNTSNVTNMSSLFRGASAFNQPLNTWDTSNVTDMRAMFSEATAFNSDISTWNTSNVTNMSSMFSYVSGFNADISGWNTGNVAGMSYMFYQASSFNSDISNWDTGSVTNMASMFERAYAFNQPIGNWDVSNVTNMTSMFETDVVFNQDLTNWNTGSVTNMHRMFYQATAFNGDISTWDTSNVTDMINMFYQAKVFNSDISGWNTSNVVDMSSMFNQASSFNRPIGNWLTGKVAWMTNMFKSASAFNHPIGNWDVSSVVDMSNMFSYATKFNQDLSRWNTSKVKAFSYTFTAATAFNGDISTWDTSSATDMSSMFIGASAFNSDISGWDVSKVKDMEDMFNGAWAFNRDISGWDVSNVTDMGGMFQSAHAFNQPIGNWDVSNVTSMYGMFAGTTSFNGDISGWDVSNVESMSTMFHGASAFNRDLSNWCVSNVTTKPPYFDTVIESTSWVLPRPVWGTCPRGENMT